jgi:phosphoglycerate dehydrogenase-like enzyme
MAGRHKIVLHGAPVIGFADRLRGRLPDGADIVTVNYGDPREILSAAFAGADIVITNRFTRDNHAATSLKLIQVPGAGFDEIDLGAIPDHIPVCNVFEHEAAVAEFVLLAMLEHGWNLTDAEADFRAGSWRRSSRFGGRPATELGGKTLGIVGFGRVGRAVAARAAAFGMNIVAASRSMPSPPADHVTRACRLPELRAMLPGCDYVVVSCALAEETRGLFGEPEFAAMKPTAFLINVSRSAVVDERALHAALRDRTIAGAQIDVWYRYPDPEDENQRPSNLDFGALGNVRMTPHIAGWTEGTIARRWDFIAENVSAVLSGHRPKNIIRKLLK